MPPSILNIAAYKFVAVDDVAALRASLAERARAAALKGTILIAPEGINLFLAGSAVAVESFVTALLNDARFADIDVKRSWSAEQPFRRLLVKAKREIVTMRTAGIDPAHHRAPSIAPAELKALLDAGAPVVLLDTRNQFEVEIGTFRGARSLALQSFAEFPARVSAVTESLKDATVVTFCTGGIRCEKATPFLQSIGFSDVRQLEGGILRYFEACGDAHFDGACFVFDERVALDARLAPLPVPAGR